MMKKRCSTNFAVCTVTTIRPENSFVSLCGQVRHQKEPESCIRKGRTQDERIYIPRSRHHTAGGAQHQMR